MDLKIGILKFLKLGDLVHQIRKEPKLLTEFTEKTIKLDSLMGISRKE